MLISKKHNIDGIESIYIDLTRTYLSSLKSIISKEDLDKYCSSTYLISEGYRNALCLVFDLETEASTFIVKKYENDFVNVLRPIYLKYDLRKYSMEKRKGILEACVHCIEKSRKLVDCV